MFDLPKIRSHLHVDAYIDAWKTSFLALRGMVQIIALRRSTTSKRQATFGRIPQRQLRMVATPEKAGTTKTLAKIEQIKIDSMQLREPLLTEMKNDEIFVSHDAYQILKYHGSYQQDNRELRKPKQQKAYSFMLRLKMPCGDVPAHLYRLLDDLCDEFGEHNLRATTRQAFQMHGVMKGDLKEVIQQLRAAGSSTVGACGDVSRNVMCTPAPIVSKPYAYAREYSKVMGELLKPSSTAFSEIWLGEEKVAAVEYWRAEIGEANKELSDAKVAEAAAYDNGRGIIIAGERGEPLYGKQYLPRKFKMAVTVPGQFDECDDESCL